MSTAIDPTAELLPIVEALAAAIGVPSLRTTTFRGTLRVVVPADRVLETLTFLKEQQGFRFLSDLGATDYWKYPDREAGLPRFEVHYVLRDLDRNLVMTIKTGVDDPGPSLPTAVPLWAGANWMEREVFDLFGIRFDGHPDLRRILMPDEFTAHPLRKDYPLRGRGERHNFERITRGQS